MSDALPRRWPIPGAVYLSHVPADRVRPVPLTPVVAVCADMQLSQPTLDDTAALLAFERANRAYFEQWINPRDPGYYSQAGVAAAIEQAVREAHEDLGYQFLIKVEGDIVGRVNLKHALRPYFNKVELGYRMGERHAGRGYATQAVSLILPQAFQVLKFGYVEATVRELNAGSLRVLEKNGFRRYGRSERSVQFGGEWFDLLHLRKENGITHTISANQPETIT